MISVPIDRIVPLTDARDNFSRLVADVENITDGLYVLTKGGKPAIALINIKYLEEIMSSGQLPDTASQPKTENRKPTTVSSAPKPFVAPPPVFPKAPEPIKPSPAKDDNFFKSANLPTPSFEPPKVSDSNESPKTGSSPSSVTPPSSNYDVKPVINPSWTGEPVKNAPPSPISVASVNTAPINQPVAPSTPPIKPLDQSPVKPFESTQAKPTVNPWPIIPPRQEPPKPVTAPPLQSPAPATPTISSTTVPPSITPPLEINKTAVPPSLPKPEDSYPKMVAPPPPLPPSSLPNIPSSFVAVPVPIHNGTKSEGNVAVGAEPAPINGNKGSLPTSSPAIGQNSISTTPNIKPEASGQVPGASLPPPPKIDTPAPFSPPVTTAPATVAPKPTEAIQFDAPPTIVPDPGEEMLPKPVAADTTSATKSDNSVETDTPPQSQSSVQDLEI